MADTCQNCNGPLRVDGTIVQDPRYTGPVGHAPQNVCYDCWCAYWDEVEQQMLNGGDSTKMEAAFFLVSIGYTQAEAAQVVGVSRKTITRWKQQLQKKYLEIQSLMSLKAEDSPRSKYTEGGRGGK